MPRVQCPNPSCRKVYSSPDSHMGKKVRCKVCQTLFVASPYEGDITSTSTVEQVASVPAQPAAPVTSESLGAGTIIAAVVAFLLPVLGASGFVAFKALGNKNTLADDGTGKSLHAGIEIGAKGIKSVVLEVIPDPEFGFDVDPQGEPRTINTTLVAGLETNNRFDPDAVRETGQQVSRLYQDIIRQQKVSAEHIYVVGSSGLFSTLRRKPGLGEPQRKQLIRANKEALAEAVLKAVGKTMRFIEAEDEAEWCFKGVVPRPHATDSVLFDIGSGNTKAAYAGEQGAILTAELPFGTITFHDLVKKVAEPNHEPFGDAAERMASERLFPSFRTQMERKPGLRNQKRVYLCGGAAWALASFTHPESRRAMVEIMDEDIESFAGLMAEDPAEADQSTLGRVADEAARKEAQEELKKVHKAFTQEQLIAGSQLLKGLGQEAGFSGKKVYFARHGLFGWILFYVGERGSSAP